MALTRPTFNNINTSNVQAFFNDPQVTLNYGNVTANNQDIGFVFNRGASGNVAIVWSEAIKGFTLAYTTSSGLTAGNVDLTGNANLQIGNLAVSGITTLNSSITATDLILSGNLTVNGTTTTINSTTVTTNDKNIVVANNQSTSSGIDAGGSTPIATWRYNNATTSWQSNVSITPAATNTLTLGGSSNYWNNIYATTHTGTTGSFTGTITSATVNAATIGNTGAAIIGATISASTIGNSGATLTGTTVNAATIGNTGAVLVATTANVSGNARVVGNITVGNILATGYFYANGYAFTGGGGGNPGGSSGQIQYNSGGLFTGASGLITDGSNLTLNAQGDIRFADSDSSNWVAFQAPATIASNVTWTLPAADGSANQALVTNGSGTLAWAAAGAAITDDSSTSALYPAMATATSGYLTDARVSSTKFSFNASTGTVITNAVNAATIGNTGALLTGTLQTAAQPNITSVGTLSALTVSGALSGNTITASTSISRNSRNVPTYVAAVSAPASPLQGDFWYDTSTDKLYQYIFDGTNSQWVDQSPPSTFANLTVSGNPVFNGYVTINSSNNATAIVNGGTTGTGNIGATGATFNTIFAKATTAQYADLAENYLADTLYQPGTVVVFGGTHEITTSGVTHDTRVAGVISTDPGFLMNEGLVNGLPVAFTGRVPCMVQGPVQKGDCLVNIDHGLAGKLDPTLYQPGCIIGKSLEDINDNIVHQIEVVVGRY